MMSREWGKSGTAASSTDAASAVLYGGQYAKEWDKGLV